LHNGLSQAQKIEHGIAERCTWSIESKRGSFI